ncbi:lycopene cyclase family protein [Pedobacter metabolipauper]|uniref:Lycopene beta-cyclase n=1 Tax=Pedobacter metabolipauper TaxID=425513 RepID=A0A4R6SYF4_9SPHI|nr:lycopene cyclase family protein [Pedobacter metabolipauper]TDQ11087.1 lycopene beta-cyclase [Pedobacter metabolipauper]
MPVADQIKNEHVQDYDIIVCGGGLAGLSLVFRAFKSGTWKNERVLIIDQETKESNDRTWSFWEKEPSVFENLIDHKWQQLVFYANSGERLELNHLPYTYNTIRSKDFYQYIRKELADLGRIEWRIEAVESVVSETYGCKVKTSTGSYWCRYAFSSIFQKPESKKGGHYFMQHFKGIRIKTADRDFEVSEAYLMDFRTSQEHGTTFFYTLPMAQNEVFIEYTLFSKQLLDAEEYDVKIAKYLQEVLGVKNYEILETEFGVIPMTDHIFDRSTGNVMYIGTIGGDTRGSTGYTFSNVQKTITRILEAWNTTGQPFFKHEHIGKKEKLYDATLLDVLDSGKYKGHQLFTDLFKRTNAKMVFSFLDAESTLTGDLKIMSSLKTMPFLTSFIKVLKRKIMG